MNATNSKPHKRVSRSRSDVHTAAEPEGSPASTHPTIYGIMKAYEADMRLKAARSKSRKARVAALQAAGAASAYAERFTDIHTGETARIEAQTA